MSRGNAYDGVPSARDRSTDDSTSRMRPPKANEPQPGHEHRHAHHRRADALREDRGGHEVAALVRVEDVHVRPRERVEQHPERDDADGERAVLVVAEEDHEQHRGREHRKPAGHLQRERVEEHGVHQRARRSR